MYGTITIMGLGPGSIENISLGSIERLKKSTHVYLRTQQHPMVSDLREMGIHFKSFGWVYEENEDFQEVYKKIAKEVIERAKEEKEIIYAVPGHPLVAEESVERLIKLCKESQIEVKILPAMSFIDVLIGSLEIDPIHGLKIIDGLQISSQGCDTKVGNIITQVYSPLVASQVKLQLMEYYKDETMIWVVDAAGVKGQERLVCIPLYELDRQPWIGHLTSIYIPPIGPELLSGGHIGRLLDIMETLRSEYGCPWDREQDHNSLKQNLIEEAYEVLDAIDRKSMLDLEEELGDLLLQVVFHSQIAKEDGYFSFNDVIRGICDKLVYRHPHIFSNVKVNETEEVLTNWEKLKKVEKGMESQTEVLKAIPVSLPSLMRAFKVQKKAADVGFDFKEMEDVIKKVKEEWNELMEVYSGSDEERIIEEVGDLLFSIVNIARFLKIQPELALGQSIEKFINRFSYIEKISKECGGDVGDMTLKEMNNLWEQSKTHVFGENNKNF